MVKRIFVVITSVMIFLGLLSGCGKKQVETPNNNDSENIGVVEKIIDENDNIMMTSYVDSYNNLLVEYPVFYFEDDPVGYTLDITSSVQSPFVNITSILGDSLHIYYPADEADYNGEYASAQDFYNNYFLGKIGTYSGLVKSLVADGSLSCHDCTLTNNTHVGSYDFNDLKWEKYKIEIGNSTEKRNYELWITMKNNIPYIVKFDMVSSSVKPDWNEVYVPLSDSLWTEIVNNSELIRQYIVENIRFVDNKQELLNYKEISILGCNASHDKNAIFSDDMKLSIKVPGCRTSLSGHGDSYKGEIYYNNGLSIDNVYDNIPQQDILNSGVLIYKSLELIGSEEAYTITNASMGSYQVKKYMIKLGYKDVADMNYSMYVFRNDQMYGFIINEESDDDIYNNKKIDNRISNIGLDFAIKNLKLNRDDMDYDWTLDDLK